ncbi:protein DEFECTIVE IN MERISTEM SILENCING 3-like isoform X2 [Gastrolobium bilobum]|uniref:protein DEFECTIVE IN MERISTEM SILENCING 3-like isoform X2 n=1 Tax=Gastrolobium bilobum TaxID=150636 RepID=UPI002AAF191A|nr:protein DEFECTIVE IN MERISTEM SILENCING 3-like isoform X2 [Gastrolobium bilobum]
MFPSPITNQSVHTEAPSIQGSSALVPVNLNEDPVGTPDNVQTGGYQQADYFFRHSQKLQDDLRKSGIKIKQHEDSISLLNTERNKLEDSIRNLQVTIGKSESSSTTKIGNVDNPNPTTDEEVNKQILQHEKSAAGILCQLKTRHGAQVSHLTPTKDVVGIVAMLGKIEDDNLSRLFSEYIGVETMLAIVCRTYEGVKAIEMYDTEGCINKSCGLHGLGASIGRALDGRFLAICLESLRPYAGKYVVDDPQRKLDILNPRLPNGECPAGFLGFAVNMISVDSSNLFCVTPSGYGLRETLFYNLFSRLQVYKTRAEMLQALPCISDGALSLDGGMVRSCGVFSLGNREDVHVRFPTPEKSMGLDNNIEIETQLKEMTWKKEKILEELKRERTLLDMAKFNFNKKRNEFVKFLAQSSSYATEVQTAPNRFTSR